MAPVPVQLGEFPRSTVERILGQWWDDKVSSTLSRRRSPEECRRLGGTVFDIQPELSSTQAVPVLLDLADLLGYEPDKAVVRRGGYRGRADFVQGMSERIEADHAKRTGGKKPAAVVATEGVNNHAQL